MDLCLQVSDIFLNFRVPPLYQNSYMPVSAEQSTKSNAQTPAALAEAQSGGNESLQGDREGIVNDGYPGLLQKMADNSDRVQGMARLQAMANNFVQSKPGTFQKKIKKENTDNSAATEVNYRNHRVIQGKWILNILNPKKPDEEYPVWEESTTGFIYDPLLDEWNWGDDEGDEDEEERTRFKISLLQTMNADERNSYLKANPGDRALLGAASSGGGSGSGGGSVKPKTNHRAKSSVKRSSKPPPAKATELSAASASPASAAAAAYNPAAPPAAMYGEDTGFGGTSTFNPQQSPWDFSGFDMARFMPPTHPDFSGFAGGADSKDSGKPPHGSPLPYPGAGSSFPQPSMFPFTPSRSPIEAPATAGYSGSGYATAAATAAAADPSAGLSQNQKPVDTDDVSSWWLSRTLQSPAVPLHPHAHLHAGQSGSGSAKGFNPDPFSFTLPTGSGNPSPPKATADTVSGQSAAAAYKAPATSYPMPPLYNPLSSGGSGGGSMTQNAAGLQPYIPPTAASTGATQDFVIDMNFAGALPLSMYGSSTGSAAADTASAASVSGDVLVDINALALRSAAAKAKAQSAKLTPPASAGKAGDYKLYGSAKGGGEPTILRLAEGSDGLMTDGNKNYKILNIGYKKSGIPYVSEDTGKKRAAQPTAEFLALLEANGMKGSGKIQDRIHHAIVALLQKGKQGQLAALLKIKNNLEWYTEHIRQGGLNELILTSQSAAAVSRGVDDTSFDPVGMYEGREYTFVELQRDTSYPTEHFVFKEVYDGEDGLKFQNSHINGRMSWTDKAEKNHKTVGPVSPQYHLAVDAKSLKSIFDKSHSMRALVSRLYDLHAAYLATKADILKYPANVRGPQVYEMSGGTSLKLNVDRELQLFAEIVDHHTHNVLNRIKMVYQNLTDVPGRPPPSPHNPLSPAGKPAPASPSSPGWDD
jgi:hypothetical protein